MAIARRLSSALTNGSPTKRRFAAEVLHCDPEFIPHAGARKKIALARRDVKRRIAKRKIAYRDGSSMAGS